MVQIHKEELIDYISKNEKVNSLFLYGDRNKYFNELIINNILKNEEVFDLIKYVKNNNEKLEIVLEAKKDYIRECILNLKEGIFEFNLFSIEFFELKEMVIERNKDAVINCLKSLPNDILLKYFNNRVTLPIIKKYILTVINNFSEDDSHVIMLLLEKYELSYLIKIYPVVKNFILECNIDYNTFIQYGLGSIKYNNWFTDIIKIINDNKKDDFIKVLNYFNKNYYTNINDVSIIDNYLEIINRFNIYYDLIMNIINNNSLNDDLINDIKFLFKNDNIIYNLDLPKKISDIDKFKDKINSKFLNNINEDTTLMELIMIINKYILFDANLELDNIGGTEGLLSLKKSNSNSYKLCLLIDEMILYSKIIEKINNSSDKTSLLKFIKYLLNENNTNLKNIQNSFLSFSKKIKRLYEIEANTNLTKLDNIKNIDKVIDKNLSLKYGGSVYDFSDKNYVLMGHTISSKENIEDLIEGNSNGKSNFISVSAISYMGQRYYYNNDNLILAYDTLLEGSYVMGSTCNMGTNGLINDNSSEYEMVSINQRGLLETSAVTGNNSEILLYRKGLKPCGIILTNGREPRKEEALIHEKYNLPYILTQKSNTTINNPIRVFRENNYDQVIEKNLLSDKERNNLNNTLEVLNKTVKPKVYGREYTGREIGLFADAHSMFEPTIAILEDMKKQGISEIYSLGDNVGDGPEPDSLIDLLDYYGAKSIAGNSEYYNILGTEPFPYLDKERIENENWTKSKLGVSRIRKLKLYKPSIDLVVGNKRIALCHFANDIRYDFNEHSTWTFQDRKESLNPINQFLYTNSNESKIDMENIIKNGGNDPFLKGIIDAKNNPLFSGKQVIDYDAIIEGHTHFEYNDKLNDLNVYTLRAVGMGYKSKNDDNACYYILKEKVDGTFEIERKNVKYNKELLIAKIKSCGIPHNEKILRFINGK